MATATARKPAARARRRRLHRRAAPDTGRGNSRVSRAAPIHRHPVSPAPATVRRLGGLEIGFRPPRASRGAGGRPIPNIAFMAPRSFRQRRPQPSRRPPSAQAHRQRPDPSADDSRPACCGAAAGLADRVLPFFVFRKTPGRKPPSSRPALQSSRDTLDRLGPAWMRPGAEPAHRPSDDPSRPERVDRLAQVSGASPSLLPLPPRRRCGRRPSDWCRDALETKPRRRPPPAAPILRFSPDARRS